MSSFAFPTKSDLLMLSHCLPCAHGHAEQARAWQLLRLASCSHAVHLICAVDGPVSLEQWRALSAHANKLELVQAGALRRALEYGAGWVKGPGATFAGVWAAPLEPLRKRPYDAVLYTHPRLAEPAGCVPARVRVMDAAWPASERHAHALQAAGPLGRWSRRRAERAQALERRAARRCDLLVVRSWRQAARFEGWAPHIRVLPAALDLEPCATPPQVEDWDSFEVVLHADWRYAASRRAARQFRRQVWPLIRRVTPTARLTSTQRHGFATRRLDRASVVVVPVAEATLAHWPLVQAISRARAVVTLASAAQDLDARSGRELLSGNNGAELGRACVRLLRLSSLRSELGQRAWLHVDQHLSIQPRSLPLLPTRESVRESTALNAAA